MTSSLLTAEMCHQAWRIMIPAIETMYELDIANKFDGVVIVLDPATPWGPLLTEPPALFVSAIAGDDTPQKYNEIAFKKAMLSWRTGRSSRDVQQNAPHLYVDGDVKWGGSVVREGLVVAFSGIQAQLDEAISGMLADLLLGMLREQMSGKDGVMDAGGSYMS